MNILGIDTATGRMSVAIVSGEDAYETDSDTPSSHCERLTPTIGALLETAGLAAGDIGLVAVSTGPGSFTGLRIGIATAMGFAWSTGIPAVGVGTLMGLGHRPDSAGMLICPVIDARRSEAYAAVYRAAGCVPECVVEPRAVPLDTLAGILSGFDEPVILTGPAAERFGPVLRKNCNADIRTTPPESSPVSALSVARIGLCLHEQGDSTPPAALKPLYLRRADAAPPRKMKQ